MILFFWLCASYRLRGRGRSGIRVEVDIFVSESGLNHLKIHRPLALDKANQTLVIRRKTEIPIS